MKIKKYHLRVDGCDLTWICPSIRSKEHHMYFSNKLDPDYLREIVMINIFFEQSIDY